MSRLEKLFNKAVAEFEKGAYSQAESSLKKLNKLQTGIPAAQHLMGLIALETGRPKRAIRHFGQLVKDHPANAEYRGLYGSALLRAGMPEKAVLAFDEAIETNPEQADLHYNRALAASAMGDVDSAESGFREALRLAPDLHDAWFNLGQLLRRQNRNADALDCFESVLRADETVPDALIEAGQSLTALGRFAEAAAYLSRAMQQSPQDVQGIHAYGVACFFLKRYDNALAAFQRALDLSPEAFQIFNSLGNLHLRLGRLADAESCFRTAMALAPQQKDAALNLSGLLLLTGAFDEGWRLFETMRDVAYQGAVPGNVWDGGDLADKTIRVYGDQGIGDVVMFAGLLPDLISRAGQCIAEVDSRLVPLFERSFGRLQVIGLPKGAPPGPGEVPIHAETTFSELPRYLRPALHAAAGRSKPYLLPDPTACNAIRDRYRSGSEKFLIGLAWRSHNLKRPERDAPLALWGPILSLANAKFVSLQYGESAEDIADAARRHGVAIFDDPEIDQNNSLDGLASQIGAMDLVISISQSSAHFAGALGKTVLTMLPMIPDWRYGLTADKAIWYPSMRLYRQSEVDVWDDVISAVAADAAAIIAEGAASRS